MLLLERGQQWVRRGLRRVQALGRLLIEQHREHRGAARPSPPRSEKFAAAEALLPRNRQDAPVSARAATATAPESSPCSASRAFRKHRAGGVVNRHRRSVRRSSSSAVRSARACRSELASLAQRSAPELLSRSPVGPPCQSTHKSVASSRSSPPHAFTTACVSACTASRG
jgi:hypothetical protein